MRYCPVYSKPYSDIYHHYHRYHHCHIYIFYGCDWLVWLSYSRVEVTLHCWGSYVRVMHVYVWLVNSQHGRKEEGEEEDEGNVNSGLKKIYLHLDI